MAHVLLSGSTDRFPDLREMLGSWGMTVSDLTGDEPSGPHVGMCDLVLHVGEDDENPGAMPDGAQAAGGVAPAAAPLLVLGCTRPVSAAMETLADPGPLGVYLHAGLIRARSEASRLRGGRAGGRRGDYVQFIGHELRSPLAAIKTALDVLGRDHRVDAGEARMLELAARNVTRLAAAVEWSQDLLDIEASPPTPRPMELTVGALYRHLGEGTWPVVSAVEPGRRVVTDPDLLRIALNQLDRALAIGYPGSDRRLILEEGETDSVVRIVLETDAEASPVGGMQNGRSGRCDGPGAETERLARLLCSAFVLEILDLEPRYRRSSQDHHGLEISVPVARPVMVV